jgi:large subunit ribosomal protein L29
MAKMRELKDLSADDLKKKESDLREELFNLRFQKKVGQMENPLKIRSLRRDIARVKTLMSERRRSQTPKVVAEVK